MTALDDLLSEGTDRTRGCYLCGNKTAACVSLRLIEVSDQGQVKKGGRSTSRTKSFCAEHAAPLFESLRAQLVAK